MDSENKENTEKNLGNQENKRKNTDSSSEDDFPKISEIEKEKERYRNLKNQDDQEIKEEFIKPQVS